MHFFQNIFQKNKLEQNQLRLHGYDLFLAVVLAFAAVLTTRVKYAGSMGSATVANTYIGKFGISAVFLFFVLLCFFYCVISFMDSKLHELIKKLCSYTGREKDFSRIIKFWSILLPAAWFPFYSSYYPGGVFSDTLSSISYSISGDVLNNRHPVFFNILINLFIKIGGGDFS